MPAHPKPMLYIDHNLRKMANGRVPLLRVPGDHSYDVTKTVACHANWLWGGKGLGKKCHDFLSVWGSNEANMWLDQGSKEVKAARQAYWWAAYRKQLREWEKIIQDPWEPERFKVSAGKAINAFIDWVKENSQLFDHDDWQLEYKEREYV